jgi:hypothetical protein
MNATAETNCFEEEGKGVFDTKNTPEVVTTPTVCLDRVTF